jgi:hypothetical protein
LTFRENNVDTNVTHSTGTASFTNAPDLTILP